MKTGLPRGGTKGGVPRGGGVRRGPLAERSVERFESAARQSQYLPKASSRARTRSSTSSEPASARSSSRIEISKAASSAVHSKAPASEKAGGPSLASAAAPAKRAGAQTARPSVLATFVGRVLPPVTPRLQHTAS